MILFLGRKIPNTLQKYMRDKNQHEQTRIAYTIPVIIKGKNLEERAYVEKTTAENVTRRGVFFCTNQPLTQGSQVRLYSCDDPTRSIAKVEVVWIRQEPTVGVGAKLVGRNDRWMKFLVQNSISVVEDEEVADLS
ncbi:MAG: hypothetical protein JNN15_11085 [Blastocatellia bacterium]|nr:hypothetical protein [Blastocatellia bacterium]